MKFEDAKQNCVCGEAMVKGEIAIIFCSKCGTYHIPRQVNIAKLIEDYEKSK